MDTFGKKNEEEFVYLSDSEPKRLKQYDKRPAIILQPFDSAVDALEKELAQKIIDEIEFQERVLTKDEKEKIQKAAKLIISAAKKMKKLMEDRPVWDYKALADAQARLYKQPHILAREAAEILDIDPLEQFQEEIIELAKLYPKVIKPEKIYGDRWYEFLKKKGIDPKTLEPIGARPKYPATKKEVEEELRKAGIPEEKVKIVAPRLATAVWLDKWFENAAKSYTYKKLGGVPLDELKNLRNMILAKNHLLENAAKVMEEHWTRNNHVKIGEEHVDPKFLPLVREHIPETFEDLENIRKAVKEGKMSVEEAIARIHAELFVTYRALEFIGELTGAPDCLAPNPRPLGVSDRYVVKLDKVRKIHEKLRGTLEIYL